MLQRPQPSETLRAAGFDALSALGSAQSLEDIYRAGLSSICLVCGVERASILLLDDAGVAHFVAWRGLSEEYRRAADGHFPWPVDAPAPQSIFVSDAAQDASMSDYRELFASERIASLAFVPLISQGRLLGKFMLYDEASRFFGADEMQVAESVASHLAAAIARVNFAQDREERLVRERTLRRLLETSLAEGSLTEVLERCLAIVLEGGQLYGSSNGMLFLADPHTRELTQVAAQGVHEQIRQGCATVASGHCLCGAVAASGEYLANSSVDGCHTHAFPDMDDHGHRIMPILDGDRLLGVLNCYAEAGRLPRPQEEAFLGAACQVLAGVIRRHQAQDALTRAQEDLRGMIEYAPEGIAIHRDGRLVLVNEAVCETLGYGPGELVGVPVMQVLAAEERAVVAERIARMMETGEPSPPRVERMIRKDGSDVFVEATSVRLTFEGEPSVLVMARDVDERERLTTKAMEADRLIALGTLAAGVGHEINNPLTYVSANIAFAIESLREGDDIPAMDQDVLEALTEAREGADRIAAIVRDLKAMTRSLGADVNVEVSVLLDRATRLLRQQVQQRARFVVEHGASRMVCGDPGRLGQVLLNLLTNAAQACSGEAQQHLVSMRSWDDGDQVCIEVADDGHGIPRELLGRVYDPFFTTKPVGEGTGLGLAICRRIVDEHLGDLTMKSAPGLGTKVVVRLPAVST